MCQRPNLEYCVKCKRKTETVGAKEIISKNNKHVLQGVCNTCRSKKSSFLSTGGPTPPVRPLALSGKNGAGLGNTIVKAIGALGELHLPANKGEYVSNGSFNNQNKYSYCGPGTKYDQRNNEGYQGINELDKMCKLHDKFYNENEDTASRNVSDVALAHRASEIANDPRFDSKQRRDAAFVNMIMKNKARFGLGFSKNV